MVNRRAPLQIWQNVSPDTGNWIAVELRQPGINTRAVGGWIEVDEDQRMAIGIKNNVLGTEAILGERLVNLTAHDGPTLPCLCKRCLQPNLGAAEADGRCAEDDPRDPPEESDHDPLRPAAGPCQALTVRTSTRNRL